MQLVFCCGGKGRTRTLHLAGASISGLLFLQYISIVCHLFLPWVLLGAMVARGTLSSSDHQRSLNENVVINKRRYLGAAFHSGIKYLDNIYYRGTAVR